MGEVAKDGSKPATVETARDNLTTDMNAQPVDRKIRFFAGVKRFYTNKVNRESYQECRWLKRLCVLDANENTLSLYKSRENWFPGWRYKKSGREVKSGATKKVVYYNLIDADLKDIDLSQIPPCKVLTLEHCSLKEFEDFKNRSTKANWRGVSWLENRIVAKGTDENCYKYCFSKHTPYQVWVLSVYDMFEPEKVVARVEQVLRDNHLLPPKVRRRLSPGESFLHRLRQNSPYRDSPVLLKR